MVDRWSRVVFICFASFFLLFGCTVEQQLLNSRQERLALLQLRSSLGLRSREWPIRSDPCTLWAGIECSNGMVTGIDISGFRRTRRGSRNPQFSVDALQNLTRLSSFNASNFPLPGPIPIWLGLQLNALQVLDLRSCSINGAIPFTLGNLTTLVELYLSNNNLTGVVPSNLAQLVRLSVLDLSRNLFTGPIPDSFANFRNLTVLDMSSNFLSGEIPVGIWTLSGLQFLNLSRNSLSSSIPAQLGNLANLTDLDFGFNSLSGPIPANLSNLVNLQRLIIGNNFLSGQLTNNLFVSMVQLRVLVLNHNGFVGEFPDSLWSIPSLQFLDVSVNNFTGVLPEISSNAFNSSNTAVYNISKNLFYGNITSLIRNYGFIDMSGNYFQGPVPISGTTSLSENCLRNATNQRSLSECASFYSERNLVFDNFGQPNTTQQPAPPRSDKNNNRNRTVVILTSVFGGVGLVALVIFIIMLLILCKRKRTPQNQRGISVGPIPLGGASPPPPPGVQLINFSNLGDGFTYNQILKATSEFNEANLIKNGHSGDLFRGVLEGGLNVVIKRVDLGSSVKKESYVSELELFTKVSHTRLVPLLGHCLENENEKFIVYKHMKNGDLSTSLFKKTNSDDSLQSLDWITRLKIAIGAAEGLSYLHHECNPPLVHRDVQASSILLDDKFEVRLGSLSEVCVQEGDTNQNRITRLLRLPQTSDQGASGTLNATCAYDVYCFGKVLLELVTGKLGISSSTDTTMKDYLETTLPHISIYDKELVTNIVDPSLIIDEDLLEEVWAMAIVARSCLNPKPNRRPLMRYILKALENPLKVVREEQFSSARLRATSSRASWNGNIFSSWRSSDVGPTQGGISHKIEEFQESGQIGDGNGHSSRRHSKEIFPEPLDELERVTEG